jgi:glycosyltransferase involved in cell wall biosynthesis
MNISLMDPGLIDVAGHHFDLDLKMVRLLRDDGHRVRVYCHRAAIRQVLDAIAPHAEVIPLFQVSPYLDHRTLDAHAGELIAYLRGSQIVAADLRGVAPADLWLWPTLTSAQLNACATVAPHADVSGCIHAGTRTEEQPNGGMWWRYSFLAAHRSGMRLRIGAIEPGHRQSLLPLTTDGAFEDFPNFYEGAPASLPKQSLSTIGFFGHQREEKGRSVIAPLVRALTARGYRLVVQDSRGRFIAANDERIRVMRFVENLAEEISRCDLVVLPYAPDRYRNRGSGILMDALASGVPVVAPRGTFPGHWVEQTGAGTQFVSPTPEEILSAIERARTGFPALAAAAHAASIAWKQRYGLRRFVDAMLGKGAVL